MAFVGKQSFPVESFPVQSFLVYGSLLRTIVRHRPNLDRSCSQCLSLYPEGIVLFAIGSESGRLASYLVDADRGEPTPLETYSGGKRTMGAPISDFDGLFRREVCCG